MPASEGAGPEPVGAAAGESLGTRLSRAREQQDLAVDDLAAELRIASQHLLALEQGRFDGLGAPVFAKGYLKQYAARLGLDVAAVAAEYDRTVGSPAIQVAPSKSIHLRDERQIMLWVVAGVVLVVLAGLLSLWWWRQDGTVELPPIVASPAATVAAPGPAATTATPGAAPTESRAASVDTGPVTDNVPEATRDTTELAVTASVTAAGAIPSGEVPTTPSGEASESQADLPDQPVAGIQTTAQTDAAIEGPVLEIEFVEDSWAEIAAADGSQLYYGLARAGTTQRYAADSGINLLLGNAPGVVLRLDGQVRQIPSGARRRGDLAQFDLGTLFD